MVGGGIPTRRELRLIHASAITNLKAKSAKRQQDVEGNERVEQLRGRNLNEKTPPWRHDNPLIRVPSQFIRAAWHAARESRPRFLSKVSFFAGHYAYFAIVCLATSLIFWGISAPTRSISYADSLFLVVSAMTATGLRTINLSRTTTAQQVILVLLMIFGSRIWISICVVFARKGRFDEEFGKVLDEARRRVDEGNSPPPRPPTPPSYWTQSNPSANNDISGMMPYLSWEPTEVYRDRGVFALTTEQRDELGGIEYRAVKQLLHLLLAYLFLWQILGCIALGYWMQNNLSSEQASQVAAVHPWWLGIFTGVSAFNNVGLSLVDASMIPFQESYFVIITAGLLIQAGCVGFPALMRFIISALSMVTRKRTAMYENLRFILDHPSRVSIYLFSSRITWSILSSLLVLNVVNWAGFILFGLGNGYVGSIPTGPRVLAGLFQAFCIRFGGFHIVNVSRLHIGLQVLYGATMLSPHHPIVPTDTLWRDSGETLDDDTPRRNIYGQTSLARNRDDQPEAFNGNYLAFFGQIARRQLVRQPIWILALAVFVITTIEADHFGQDAVQNSTFKIMFEIVSAYCGSGVSVGWPDEEYSFSGGWHDASKVILCAVMLRGRHRDIPDAIYQAVQRLDEAPQGIGNFWASNSDS